MSAQRSLLVVDDDPVLRTLLASSLATSLPEFQVLLATGGDEALRLLDSTPIDLLLTDLLMPAPDGFAVLAEMAHRAPWVPVAVMTSHSDPALEERLRRTGMVLCLHKPLDLRTLPGVLRSVVAQRTRGELAGITVFSLLTVLSLEQRSTRLALKLGQSAGYVDVCKGELWNARGGGLEGLAFVHEALSWEAPQVSLGPLPQALGKRAIHASMQSVLRAEVRRQDDVRAREQGQGPVVKRSPALTAARRWSSLHEAEGGTIAYLRELAQEGASGELVASAREFELHLHLAQGRLVWATSSGAKANFFDALIELGVAEDELRSVLQECRRAHLPLLETLLEWNVVTLEQLEGAMRWHFVLALGDLAQLRRRECVFLRREAAPRKVSFDTLELLDELERIGTPGSEPPVVRPSTRAPAPLYDDAASALPPLPKQRPFMTAELALGLLQESNSRLSFVELEGPAGSELAGAAPRVWTERLAALRTESRRHEPEVLVLRYADGVLLGHRMPAEAILWTFAYPAEFSATLLGMMRLAPRLADSAGASAPPEAPFRPANDELGAETRLLCATLERLGGAMLSAWLTAADGTALYGAQRGLSCEAELAPLAQSFNPLLPAPSDEQIAAPSATDPPLGLALLDAKYLWVAGWLDRGSVLWLSYRRNTPQGLGWMHLHQVRRSLLPHGRRAGA